MGNFNREMLTLARESRNMTQTAFAKEVGISGRVSKYETGLKTPSPEMLLRMADKVDYTEDFFYLQESMRDFGSAVSIIESGKARLRRS